MNDSRPATAPTRPTRKTTCAVIVTFHPDETFPERFTQVMRQFPLAIIVDNGSRISSLRMLQTLAEQPNVILLPNAVNGGIAKALNQGIEQAKMMGFDWVVTLDQDTCLCEDFLETVLEVYDASGGGRIVIGSNYFEAHRGRNFIQQEPDTAVFKERKTLITSGTMVPLILFDQIGVFREDYFIDSVDHEFSLRARAHGYRMLITCRPLMKHSIGLHAAGQRRVHLLLSFNHPPKRKYFISRNSIFTAIRYFSREPAWSTRQIWRLFSDFLSILVLEDSKAEKAKAFMIGIFHGIRGKLGPIEETWPHGLR